eukprot:gene6651-2737_t
MGTGASAPLQTAQPYGWEGEQPFEEILTAGWEAAQPYGWEGAQPCGWEGAQPYGWEGEQPSEKRRTRVPHDVFQLYSAAPGWWSA